MLTSITWEWGLDLPFLKITLFFFLFLSGSWAVHGRILTIKVKHLDNLYFQLNIYLIYVVFCFILFYVVLFLSIAYPSESIWSFYSFYYHSLSLLVLLSYHLSVNFHFHYFPRLLFSPFSSIENTKATKRTTPKGRTDKTNNKNGKIYERKEMRIRIKWKKTKKKRKKYMKQKEIRIKLETND